MGEGVENGELEQLFFSMNGCLGEDPEGKNQLLLSQFLENPSLVVQLDDPQRAAFLSTLWQYFCGSHCKHNMQSLVEFLLGMLSLLDFKYPEREEEKEYCLRLLRQLSILEVKTPIEKSILVDEKKDTYGLLSIKRAKISSAVAVLTKQIDELPPFSMADLCDFLRESLNRAKDVPPIVQAALEKLIKDDLMNSTVQNTLQDVIQSHGNEILALSLSKKMQLFKGFPEVFDFFMMRIVGEWILQNLNESERSANSIVQLKILLSSILPAEILEQDPFQDHIRSFVKGLQVSFPELSLFLNDIIIHICG